MTIKYRLAISTHLEHYDYQYFTHLCDASEVEEKLKNRGFRVKMEFYSNGQWV